MDNESDSKKKRGRKPKDGGDADAARGHKEPWQQKYATPDEIKRMLDDRVALRYNEVRHRTEIRWLTAGPELRTDEQGLLTIFAGENGGVTDGYVNMTDRDVNTLWERMYQEKPLLRQHLQCVIESAHVPRYHPFREYLDALPPWSPGQDDAIMALAMTVCVRGGPDEQILFWQYLKKWLVGMVASWVDPYVVNNVMLVLIGPQGSYKTTWFSRLLPPQLQTYFHTKTNAGLVTKDDLLVLAQYGLVCWEELDTMAPRELNKLNAAMTMPAVNERAAYERYHEWRPHLASFCGTGNNVQFLSDTTGTRRWLPFEVVSVESPQASPFDYDAIYAQAYALYRQGFRYWFDRAEIEQLQRHNERFETTNDEVDLVAEYFRPPRGAEQGEFMRTAVAKQLVSSPGMNISTVALGRAFRKLGFQPATIANNRGFYVVRITPEERKQRAVALAYEARHNDGQSAADDTDDTDHTDVF